MAAAGFWFTPPPPLPPPFPTPQVGQFFAARSEFVPEPVCRELAKLHDRVPPMPAARARPIIEGELGGAPLGDIFEWIDLDSPLGSASVAQVHKARLRGAPPARKRGFLSALARCRLNPLRGRVLAKDARALPPPGAVRLVAGACDSPAAKAAAAAATDPRGPASPDGVVAVKVQYPGAAALMAHDITHVRVWAKFLSKTEIAFDLVSAVDELDGQVSWCWVGGRGREEWRVCCCPCDNTKPNPPFPPPPPPKPGRPRVRLPA